MSDLNFQYIKDTVLVAVNYINEINHADIIDPGDLVSADSLVLWGLAISIESAFKRANGIELKVDIQAGDIDELALSIWKSWPGC